MKVITKVLYIKKLQSNPANYWQNLTAHMPMKISSKTAGTMPSQPDQVGLNIACVGNQDVWGLPHGLCASSWEEV